MLKSHSRRGKHLPIHLPSSVQPASNPKLTLEPQLGLRAGRETYRSVRKSIWKLRMLVVYSLTKVERKLMKKQTTNTRKQYLNSSTVVLTGTKPRDSGLSKII